MGLSPLGWLQSESHHVWLQAEEARLIGFARQRFDAHGHAVLLDHRGAPVNSAEGAPTFLTGRMAYVHAIEALRGVPGMRPVAVSLLDSLVAEPGEGWPDSPADAPDALQSLYTLDFVLLAAVSGVAIGHPRASTLLERALERFDSAFWLPDARLGVDRIDAAGTPTAYRGLNANMHLVEALLAIADVTGDPEWRERALDICRFLITAAAGRDWRICEHYDADWQALPEHNRNRPDHTFVPFGSTVGHGFEWARLIAGCAALPGAEGFAEASSRLFDRARFDGWARDGDEGFLYTVDFEGRPVSTMRLHWVAAEAVAAASVLARMPEPHPDAAALYEQWLDHIAVRFVDREHGSWRHRLDAPADAPKPDLYHSLQSMLIPQLPLAPSVLGALLA